MSMHNVKVRVLIFCMSLFRFTLVSSSSMGLDPCCSNGPFTKTFEKVFDVWNAAFACNKTF